MMGSFMGRGNQYIQLVKVLYCKLPINGKQLPAFPLEVRPGFELRSQRWEARVLPLCHCGPTLFMKNMHQLRPLYYMELRNNIQSCIYKIYIKVHKICDNKVVLII